MQDRRRLLAVGLGAALSSPVGAKSRPWAIRRPSSATRFAVNQVESSVGRLRRELGLEVPVPGGAERDALLLPVHDEAHGDGLHAAGRQLRHDLLPQHRRDLVAVQPVEHAAGLVGLDQAVVHVARAGDRGPDRLGSDLVEDHPPGRDLGLEFLDQVPGDRLALPVLVGGEQEFVGVLEQLLELADLLALVRVHHVQGLEVGVDVDAEPGPRLLAQAVRNVSGAPWHIADMANA